MDMNDQDLERLLKSAGPRERPPAEVERAVRASLHAEWQAMLREGRVRRHRFGAFALAASIAVAAVGAWIAGTQTAGTPAAVGTLAATVGEVRERSGWLAGWRTMDGGDVVVAGRTLETGGAGRAAIALPGGMSLRLDRGTRIAFVEPSRLRLERGALYLDSGAGESQPGRLLVETPAGSVRHVGTQYELRLIDAGMQLRVREGRVEFRSPDGAVEHGRGGEQLVIFGDGRVERGMAPRSGPSWAWISDASPALDLEGVTLARFLTWAGRELGHDVEFSGAVSEADVAAVVIHGSTAGLSPTEALEAVLETTRFEATLDGERIIVDRRESN
jgi:ferric-dicitrate binding protein FerR (iron transport regulator)